MKRLEDLIRTRIGIDAAAIGRVGVHRAASARMRSLGLHSVEEYRLHLQSLPAEWNELVDAIVVTESWFFRDQPAIAAFVRLAVQEWLPAHPATPLSVLSVPCATGEEPYSLAMALLDAGVAPERFRITGVDISSHAVSHAEHAVYGKNSFRGEEPAYRRRFFRRSDEGYVLAPRIRRCVGFRKANLLNDLFLAGSPAFDFIFCRNLLIYFDRTTQKQALARLERLLAPNGLLFVGPVEQAITLEHGFISANLPSTFACRRASGPALAQRRRPVGHSALSVQTDFNPRLSLLRSPLASPSNDPPRADLETARRLADEGRLKDAAEVCETYLRRHRDCAEAYFQLGLVREASGDVGAIDCYRKALYLEPNHYESLLHMALLLHKNGEAARARTFRTRAERLRSGTVDA